MQTKPLPRRGPRVVIDGAVYGFQSHGGINTLFNEVLPRLAGEHGSPVDLLVPNGLRATPPRHPRLRWLPRDPLPESLGLYWRLDRVWKSVTPVLNRGLRHLALSCRRGCVFQSTLYSVAPRGVPQVALVYDLNHDLFPERFPPDWAQWLRRQLSVVLRAAARVIAISHQTKADLVRLHGVDPSLVDVVHLATDPGTFYPDAGPASRTGVQSLLGGEDPYLLYVGTRGDAFKNFAGLLLGYAQSSRRLTHRLAAAGPAWSPAERALVHQLGLNDRVRLVETPDGATLRRLYSCADAFVYPSLHEGFGIPLLEAMACDTPVLASDIAVFHEVAGDAARFFNPLDPRGVATALEEVGREGWRATLVARGRERVARFSWDRCAEGFSRTFKRVAEEHGF